MDVGIKQAKTDLSKLISEAQQGKRVFITNHGRRVIELAPVSSQEPESDTRGYGMFKGQINLPPGWGTQKARRKATQDVIKLMGID